MLNRRGFLGVAATVGAAGLIRPQTVAAGRNGSAPLPELRGAIGMPALDPPPSPLDDKSRAFAKMLRKAADAGVPVFLPAGTYEVSNLTLPSSIRIIGVSGATHIVYGGNGFLFIAEDAEHIELTGLTFDGGNRWIGGNAQALLDLRRTGKVVIEDCRIIGSAKTGIALEECAGRIDRNTVSGAATDGIVASQSTGLTISSNTVSGCTGNGIRVQRWQVGSDGTTVIGNHISAIGTSSPSTGDGIGLFRAHGTLVADNLIDRTTRCAIRAEECGSLRISRNACSDSGDFAIRVDASAAATLITNNTVTRAKGGVSMASGGAVNGASICSGNILRDLSDGGAGSDGFFGSGIFVDADAVVSSNVVENASVFGLMFIETQAPHHVSATGNVIRNAPTGIAVPGAAGGSYLISDNMIDSAPNGAVVGYDGANPVTGDLAIIGSGDFAGLAVARNKVS